MTERNNYTYIFFSCGRLLDVCWTLLASQSFGKPLFKGVEGWTLAGRQEKCPRPSQAMGTTIRMKRKLHRSPPELHDVKPCIELAVCLWPIATFDKTCLGVLGQSLSGDIEDGAGLADTVATGCVNYWLGTGNHTAPPSFSRFLTLSLSSTNSRWYFDDILAAAR